ncbi:MAG: TraB/GumN family protein [Kiloniellales bacterium]
MRSFKSLLLPLLLAVSVAPCPVDATDLELNGEGLLWRITAANGAVSHLFGTVHSTDERVLTLPEPAQRAFDVSRSAAFEILLTDAVEQQMAEAMVLPHGHSLSQLVGPELFNAISGVAGEYSIPIDVLQPLKPWALIAIFSFPPEELVRRQQGMPSLDERLQDEARLAGKEVVALERPEDQIAVFESLTVDQQVAIVASMVEDSASVRNWFEELLQLYLQRDVAGIYEYLVEQTTPEDSTLTEIFEQRIIFARNIKMAATMNPLLERGGVFVAIGALHLPGREGVVNLLARRGYKVERIY